MVIYLKHKTFFILSTIFSIILGTVLHFTYNFLHKPFVLGFFLPINESVFEHLKLVLIPLTLVGIAYTILFKKQKNLWYYISISTIISMIFIPITHYSYTNLFNTSSAIFDIVIYIIAMIFANIYTYLNLTKETKQNDKNSIGILLLITIYFTFIIFTICPPQIELFKDPINNTYGIFML